MTEAHPTYASARFAASSVAATLEDGTKVKIRKPRMRACDERNQKGKLCAGHLKRWFSAPRLVAEKFGDELYRCERCRTVYLPNPQERARTGTLAW